MERSSYNIILYVVALLIQEYSFVKSYSLISNKKIKNAFLTTFIFLLIAFFEYVNTLYNYLYLKPIISFLLLIILNLLIFKNNKKNIFLWTLFIFIITGILDFFYTILIFKFLLNVVLFNNNHLIKILYTVLISLSTIFSVKILKIIINKNKYNYEIDKRMVFNLILLLILIISLSFKYIQYMSKTEYVINIFVLVVTIVLMIMNFIQYLKVKKSEEKEIALVEFMTEYEKIIDDNRIIRHEMLNNLLIIKTLINSDPKRLEDTLNQIIKEYDNKSYNYRMGLYNLPSGLKGLVYYKIYDLKTKNAKINVFISQKNLKIMKEINNDLYLKIYKILGILLDNAVEACIESKEKFFMLDIYEEKNKLYFYIENSMKNKIDITKLSQKGYSTKGKKRGLGLYVVSNILEKTKEFELKQEIKKEHFISVLIVSK